MKKFFYLLTLVLTTAMFIACEPDEDDWQRPDEPQLTQHSFYMNDEGAVHQFNYEFGENLKSTLALGDIAIRYIRIVSYYSHDIGQRNINEIEVFVADTNFLYKNDSVVYASNRYFWGNDSLQNVADGLYDSYHRWSGWRIPQHDTNFIPPFVDNPKSNLINEFSDLLNAKFDRIENTLNINSTLQDTLNCLAILDTIVNTTVYPDFDTVWFQVDLREPFNVESIILYLGEHRQVFDVWVSTDGVTWAVLPKNEYIVINNPNK